MPRQRRVAPTKLAQRRSAAAVFIGDSREAVTALRSDGRRNCSNLTALRADVERDDCVMMACCISRG